MVARARDDCEWALGVACREIANLKRILKDRESEIECLQGNLERAEEKIQELEC